MQPYIPVFVSIAGLIVGWSFAYYQIREKNQRLSEALAWSLKVIDALQSLSMRIKIEQKNGIKLSENALVDAAVQTSILVEQGRMFFRNTRSDTQIQSAYSGLRPKVLDPIIGAHRIIRRMIERPDQLADLSAALDHCERKFVSLAQAEVGRSVFKSRDAASAGDVMDVDDLVSRAKHAPRRA